MTARHRKGVTAERWWWHKKPASLTTCTSDPYIPHNVLARRINSAIISTNRIAATIEPFEFPLHMRPLRFIELKAKGLLASLSSHEISLLIPNRKPVQDYRNRVRHDLANPSGFMRPECVGGVVVTTSPRTSYVRGSNPGAATGYALLMSSNKSETRVQCFPLVWTHRNGYAKTGERPFKRECAPYSPKPYNVATHGSHTSSYRQNSSVHTHSRYNTTRSSSTIGLYGSHDPQTPNLTSPTGYNYQKRSAYHTERRLDGLTRPAHYPVLRSSMSPAPAPRHHTTYTTVLKQRPPMGPRQLSQVHLTIDPECGATDASMSNGRDISSREQRLEAELNSARQELAQLRRAISLVEERHRQEYNREVRTPVSPTHIPQTRSPLSGQNQFLSNTSSSYQTQHFGSRSTLPCVGGRLIRTPVGKIYGTVVRQSNRRTRSLTA
ncbi:hypothetical protein CLF_110695 [Clonorchis sinensis]|uniref:Uncharacterized protein n=1 Tax=Clonorchis sinensis TaxID=79923 RepID=G7YTS1_CLOSI|nr:hypothetical protein CLF_110695 [Clonorchis sinensis]